MSESEKKEIVTTTNPEESSEVTVATVTAQDAEKIEKALQDPTKKRKAEDEIKIDINSSVPLSKKQKRMLRRGKITLEELNAKYNIDASSISEFEKEQKEAKEQKKLKKNGVEGEEDDEDEDSEKKAKLKKETFGVWIGNLSFDTTKEDLIRFIRAKTKTNEDEESQVDEKDIVRVKLPLASNEGKQIKNKGFCYMDFDTEAKMLAVVKLSENQLNGRNLLIKNSKSFEGRPDKEDLVASSKNPPSRILFVGNLSFDTTDDQLKSHFQHCGDITKIRMATFQDSGKCKGFAFVDFKEEASATKALKDKSCRKLALRPIRMEYGEDRSKRQVRKRPEQQQNGPRGRKPFDLPNEQNTTTRKSPQDFKPKEKPAYKKKSNYNSKMGNNNRLKSSIALSSAQRGSAAIVPSQGKKMKFD
ncbi:similar to Saccharomyces cerevisiae YNL175C NOP13 Nucleolar protein found in preribosomal complexes [Maudiozyma saulgeensis]|uniref:Similar to Saccharomyces cerevisiae YNL175C NOP13 Nucleolar protein found in preribosomal complexes n=1 Tax=Maudiozyma saulgeensis TaxID=1789683 RepID=A0A1X7R2B2_9SACH|nr:similar to Saccharomyces cerevisiae YNL175C NOP13 Nucleolar protein found in preribosomal complexes [Kazachstania saulgeensis]